LPRRPATVGNLHFSLKGQQDDGAMERRPLTAPAVTNSAHGGDDYDDEADDSDEDPSLMLANASAAIYDLKNTWRDERREKLSLLWRQLETSYTRMPPTRILDEILDPVQGTEQEKGFAGDAKAFDGCAEISDAEAAAGPVVHAAEKEAEKAAEKAADALISSAANQLGSCQQRRKVLEERLESCPGSPSACVAWPEQADMAGGNVIHKDCCDEEADRLLALRCEVERLKTTQSGARLAHSNTGGAPFISMHVCPDSVHESLNQWIQDMTVLHESNAGGNSNISSPRTPKISSPRQASHGKGTTPSRKAMAQIAEARAMKWATGQKGDMSRDAFLASMHVAPTSTKGTCPSRGSCGSAPPPVEDALVSQTPCTVEQHLDDILREFDEIDSIYGSIVKITKQ